MRRRVIAMTGAAWIAGSVLLAGCASGLEKPVHEVTATTGTDQVQRVTVTAHSFWFDPNRVVVKRGLPVELTLKNGGLFVPHGFDCMGKDAGIELHIGAGMFRGSNQVRFTPTLAGEYPFHCGVDGHAKKGMTGTLVVVEP